MKKTLTEKFTEFSNAAFKAVKKKLADLGGIMYLVEPITLYIDNDTGFVHKLEAQAIALCGNNLVIFSTNMLESGLFKKVLADTGETGDVYYPDDYWMEGSENYAEWENLLELFDRVLAAKKAMPFGTIHREQLISLRLDGSVSYYLFNEDGDACEYTAKNINAARKAIDRTLERQGGYYCESGVLVTDIPAV